MKMLMLLADFITKCLKTRMKGTCMLVCFQQLRKIKKLKSFFLKNLLFIGLPSIYLEWFFSLSLLFVRYNYTLFIFRKSTKNRKLIQTYYNNYSFKGLPNVIFWEAH